MTPNPVFDTVKAVILLIVFFQLFTWDEITWIGLAISMVCCWFVNAALNTIGALCSWRRV